MSEILKNKLHDLEIAPPEGLFRHIVKALDAHQRNLPARKIVIGNLSIKLIAASILLFILATVFLQIRPAAVNENNQQTFAYKIAGDSLSPSILSHLNALSKRMYVTLEGPQGKVKVSTRVAVLLVTPEPATKRQWNKKLTHWKNIMMTASNTNFMDVIPITQSAETEN